MSNNNPEGKNQYRAKSEIALWCPSSFDVILTLHYSVNAGPELKGILQDLVNCGFTNKDMLVHIQLHHPEYVMK